MQLRTSSKQASVYVLSVDKDGAKMTRHDPQNGGDTYIEGRTTAPLHVKMTATASSMALL